MSASKLQQEVREELGRRGFEIVRFTRPPLGEAGERFAEWLRGNRHGLMGYLERRREERLDPSLLLADLKSLVVLTHPYDSGLPNTENPAEGNISRYAWGDDYHEVMGEKLKGFLAWLRAKHPELSAFASVDASPILEKSWAERAGLGWLGKHTNIINAERGSYFFLAVLLTNLDFKSDAAPESDRCGNCERCIEVCPTRAIVAPYQLDARLCISYLTIELKGPIPRDLRPLIGNRIFGCDDCQEVCPWNRFSQPTKEGRFFPREGVRNQALTSFLSLSEAEFRLHFAGSAILRAKRRGFLRNVCVAIGNSGKPELAEALNVVLEDADALVRGHAVWAYARLLGAGARARLAQLASEEKDDFVREELAAVL